MWWWWPKVCEVGFSAFSGGLPWIDKYKQERTCTATYTRVLSNLIKLRFDGTWRLIFRAKRPTLVRALKHLLSSCHHLEILSSFPPRYWVFYPFAISYLVKLSMPLKFRYGYVFFAGECIPNFHFLGLRNEPLSRLLRSTSVPRSIHVFPPALILFSFLFLDFRPLAPGCIMSLAPSTGLCRAHTFGLFSAKCMIFNFWASIFRVEVHICVAFGIPCDYHLPFSVYIISPPFLPSVCGIYRTHIVSLWTFFQIFCLLRLLRCFPFWNLFVDLQNCGGIFPDNPLANDSSDGHMWFPIFLSASLDFPGRPIHCWLCNIVGYPHAFFLSSRCRIFRAHIQIFLMNFLPFFVFTLFRFLAVSSTFASLEPVWWPAQLWMYPQDSPNDDAIHVVTAGSSIFGSYV